MKAAVAFLAVLAAFVAGFFYADDPRPTAEDAHSCVAPCRVILAEGSAEDDYVMDYVGHRVTGSNPVYQVRASTPAER